MVSRWEARESVDRTFWAEGPSCPFPTWLFLRKMWGDDPILWWDIPSTCLIVTEYFGSWKWSSVFFEQNHFIWSSSAFNIKLNWEAGHRWKLKWENKISLLYVSVACGHLEARVIRSRSNNSEWAQMLTLHPRERNSRWDIQHLCNPLREDVWLKENFKGQNCLSFFCTVDDPSSMAWRHTTMSVMLAKKFHSTRWDRLHSRGEDLSATPRHYSRDHGFLSEPIASSHV